MGWMRCEIMASVKEVAQLANVSQGTASMVLNGKGDQYRISEATQQKIWDVAKQLNYQPNISARRLRSSGETVLPIIALFWTLDTRTAQISRFLKGLRNALSTLDGEYELLIQPYVSGQLNEVKSLITGTRFNGAIIAHPTEQDEQFLEEANLHVPIVLYQRSSNKYSFVNVDSYKAGEQVAGLFARRQHRRIGVIVPDASSKAISLRKEGFLEKAFELGLGVSASHLVYADFSEQGGYQAIKQLLQSGDIPPTALFVISDQMSVGVLMALHEVGIRVPEDIEIVGHDNDDVTQFTIPTLSTVHLPVEEMARECVRKLTELMQHKIHLPAGQILESYLVLRQSCGGEDQAWT
jgi:LacI family transcriptional regulator